MCRFSRNSREPNGKDEAMRSDGSSVSTIEEWLAFVGSCLTCQSTFITTGQLNVESARRGGALE